jgi:hypothetical protein
VVPNQQPGPCQCFFWQVPAVHMHAMYTKSYCDVELVWSGCSTVTLHMPQHERGVVPETRPLSLLSVL